VGFLVLGVGKERRFWLGTGKLLLVEVCIIEFFIDLVERNRAL
jgi:hypothetical protein